MIDKLKKLSPYELNTLASNIGVEKSRLFSYVYHEGKLTSDELAKLVKYYKSRL